MFTSGDVKIIFKGCKYISDAQLALLYKRPYSERDFHGIVLFAEIRAKPDKT